MPDLLWTDYDPVTNLGLPLGRRLAVARGSEGQLVAFSPLPGSEKAFEDLKGIGEMAAFILPSRLHDAFYGDYFDQFPQAKFMAGEASILDHPQWPLTAIASSLPELRGFRYLDLAGMPRVQEHVFLHEASGTLILADILANIRRSDQPLTRVLMRLADMGERPKPSRLFRWLVSSKPDFAVSIREVLTWEFDRIIGGHGEIVEHDGKNVFREAFTEYI